MWHAFLVALGAGLWATDTIFRHPLVQQISPFTIVYFEHIFATVFSFVFLMLTPARKHFFLSPSGFFGAAFVGILGSAIATVLFTLSFQFVNPSVSILLQKTQPIFVIFLSAVFLNEKITKGFLIWASLAMGAAYFISFPNGIHQLEIGSPDALGTFFAVFAAFLWAVSTVVGKSTLKKAPTQVLAFWRFAFGLITLYALSFRVEPMRMEIPFVPGESDVMRSLFLMALVPGFIGVSLYYKGLSKVKASTATLLELSFPVVAVAVNAYFLHLHLSATQLIAGAVLLISMIGATYVRG